ncbi:potassium channel protein [bacterium]|nr:potassium channel protein [bacterium]
MAKIKTKFILLYFIVLISVGSFGFHFIGGEQWGFVDSIYMTIITLSTVGYGEVHTLTNLGKLWTILLIIFGVSGFAMFISQLGENLMELREIRRQRVQQILKKLRNHYIIFGYGRMGAIIADELASKRVKYVVVESDEEKIIGLQEKGYQYYRGDATTDETLEAIGVKYAKGIVVALGTDQDNLFVTMSVRTLNKDANLLSRCSNQDTEYKLKRAGADKVINPYVAGGHKMAELLIEPDIEDTVSISTPQFDIDLVVEEININDVPSLIGVSIVDSNIRKKYNLIIIGIKDRKGKFELNPNMNVKLGKDQIIMLIGAKANMKEFQKKYLKNK